MTENTGTRGSAGADEDGRDATFDQTGGLMDELAGEGDGGGSDDLAPDEFGNPLRPGGQRGAVGDVADGEEPHLDPDERNP
ncbi:hypothetical protein ACFFGH_27890 [Lysobacter korlensis]|uniref:Chemotaxis protein n=1 Tax=Lysobacter korlensis TaxID=553636 RepID=A0ABV6RXG0_9GAMM